MSAFVTTCSTCGTAYFHCFVGTTLFSGHDCPELAEGYREMDQATLDAHTDLVEAQRAAWNKLDD